MPNRLSGETSPYLLQHAGNPVDWYPWGPEALALARASDRPILLSVGYSACHWCHVMAHECFEDPEVAAVMNRLFVNVKVDREERPDLDRIYQLAHQALARRAGGWPLTMFLAPDGRPFFGGTYFPKQPRHGLPGFAQVMERVAQAWREQRPAIEAQNAELAAILAQTVPSAPADGLPGPELLETARVELLGDVDPDWGGFRGSPKFPHPFEFDLLLRESALRGDARARQAVLHTLACMARGGIVDHLGGGFARYSTDGRWLIPHFEKMLCDNGPLLALYADAWLASGEPLFLDTCARVAGWVMREMQSPEGGYWSSLDADCEGEEGRFYVWDREEARALLEPGEWAVASRCLGLDGPPNFEGRHWHLHLAVAPEEVAHALSLDPAQGRAWLESARSRLFAARERRVRPGRDDKILTAWNALMIAGMVRAARVFERADWLASARRALSFVHARLWRDGRLLATHKDGRSHLNGYLDDHAFLLAALLEMLQADFRVEDLHWARALADRLLEGFEDPEAGGFWFTSHDHEALVLRAKPGPDEATPSGNGVAAVALQRLGHLLGETRYLDAAERTLKLFAGEMRERPGNHATLLRALAECLEPPAMGIVRGPGAALGAWRRPLDQRYAPASLVLSVPAGLAGLPATLDKPVAAGVNAWVCRGVTCLAPSDDVGGVAEALGAA